MPDRLTPGTVLVALALVAQGPAPAVAQPVAEWKVSVEVYQTASFCDGGRGTITVTGSKLSYFGQGMPYPEWEVGLDPDGSANKTVHDYIHGTRPIRIKVAAGTGKRDITSLHEYSNCGFRYVPD
jgi:hypothetical protein